MLKFPIKAVLLDVDGTLYRPEPLRRHMALLLIRHHLICLGQLWPTFRIIRAFRKAQEQIRREPGIAGGLMERQYQFAARATGRPMPDVQRIINYWMFERPLELLSRYCRAGLKPFLRRCHQQGLKVGALSDYPPQTKLTALGVSAWLDPQLCSASPQIGAFKPAPQGIIHACQYWEIDPVNCLYIGDRADVDQLAAQRAGARFIGMGQPWGSTDTLSVKDFMELMEIMGI